MIKHTVGKNFVCNICGVRLKRQSNPDLHLRQHTGTKNSIERADKGVEEIEREH